MKFRDNTHEDFNAIILSLPPIVRPSKRYSTITIEGSDRVIFDESGYEPIIKEVSFLFTNTNFLEDILDWLSGNGKLILDNEPNYYFYANVLNEITISDYDQIGKYKQVVVTFICQPYKYLLSSDCLTFVNEKVFSIVNSGRIPCNPIITIYGSGKITVKLNNRDIFICTIIDEYLVLDSIVNNAYFDEPEKLRNQYVSGDFPIVLPKGTNVFEFVGNITKVLIMQNERCV